MVLSLGMSFFFFNGQSLRLDEAQSFWQSSRSVSQILSLVAQDVHVPLYHELLHFWRLFGGDSVQGARLLSLVLYLATIPLAYLLGKRAYDRGTGLFVATLLALSPFMNWYANEVRMYTLLTLLVVLNQYFFIELWKERRNAERTWALYVITAVLGVFTHYFFFLNLAGQAIFFFMRRSLFPHVALRRFIYSGLCVAACFAPWLWFVFSQGQAQNASPVLSIPTTVNLFNAFSQFLFGFQDDHVNTFFLSLWPVTLILGFLAMRKSNRMDPVTEYFLVSVLSAILLAFVVSLFVTPVFESRYLIFTVPALYLLLSRLFALYPVRAATLARGALAGLMVLMLGVEVASPQTPVKEDYRAAAQYLTEHAAPQDVVVLSAPFTVYPVDYYYHGPAPLKTLPDWDRYAYGAIPAFNPDTLPAQVASTTEAHQYAWVLLSYDQGYEKQVRDYLNGHYERVLDKTFSPGLELLVYKLRYDTPLSHTALNQ